MITKERRGDYLGKTVQVWRQPECLPLSITLPDHMPLAAPQVVPHITNEIQDWISRVSRVSVDGQQGPADVCLLEFGGTVSHVLLNAYRSSTSSY